MPTARYLPSAKLVSIFFSLALSVGLVFAADRVTQPKTPAIAVDSSASSAANTDWEAALYSIQSKNASSTFTEPDPNFVNTLLTAAQSPNVTETVGKTLLVNLSTAKSQGLGNDIPTQDQIITAAAAQVSGSKNLALYKSGDIRIVETTDASMHAYGNAVMAAFAKHPSANQGQTFVIIGNAVDNGNAAELQKLEAIKAGYAALTLELAALPVPKTLAPLHLLVINDFLKVTDSYADMQTMITDPLRGLAGFQTYQTSLSEIGRVFINIAQALAKDGILFTKDEPGAAWSGFIST